MSFISPDEPVLQVGIEVVNAVSRSVALEWARDRKTFASVGFIGFAVKLVIDRLIERHFLADNTALFFSYWAPLGVYAHISRLSSYQVQYLVAMLLAAMPFIWVGLAMTTRRLRDAGWPVWVCALFLSR
jgi:uncharacterized membrane protein YhaH (DUF805 family)